MKFYISSQCSAKKCIRQAGEELASLGFSAIELTGGTSWYPGILEDLKAAKNRLGIDLMVHNYFPPQPKEFVLNLAVKDPIRRAQITAFIKDAVVLSKSYGNSMYGVHPGFRQDVAVEQEANGFFKAGDPSLTSVEAFYSMLDELNEVAKAESILIAIENLAPRSEDGPFSYLTSEADIERFLAYVVTKSHLGALVDFGHIGAASTIFGFDCVRVLDRIFDHPEKIFEIHLSENAGPRDAHGVTPLGSWQTNYLNEHSARLGEIPVVFEWSNAASKDSIDLYREFVRQLTSLRGGSLKPSFRRLRTRRENTWGCNFLEN
jgi:sugar phosphate isomerase/epimerase